MKNKCLNFISQDRKGDIFRTNLPANHLFLILRGGHTVSTSTAELGIDLREPMIVFKQEFWRMLIFFSCLIGRRTL
jgi:hypothetical protein